MLNIKDWFKYGDSIEFEINNSINSLPHSIHVIRIAIAFDANKDEINTTINVCNFLNNSGYNVCFNIMQINYIDSMGLERLLSFFFRLNSNVVIYLADSFGSMYPKNVITYISAFVNKLPNEIGFHAHNNLGLATVNSITAIQTGALWVDSTFSGFGRGAGNVATEDIMLLHSDHIDYEKVFDFIENDMKDLKKNHKWGMCRILFFCGKNNIHPSYGFYLKKHSILSQKDQIIALNKLKKSDFRFFDERKIRNIVNNL